MSDQPDVIKALGPGPYMSKLSSATDTYNTATSKFNALLQYPFLQSIVLNGTDKSDKDLRTIVQDGSGRYQQLCTGNISVAQQVNSYGRTLPTLIGALTVAKYATSTEALIAKYVAEAQAASSGNELFFKDFQNYITLLNRQIALMSSQVNDLTIQIQNADAELANANVGQVIGDLIKALFKLGTGVDQDIQVATLLKVGIDTLKTSFDKLWKDQARLKALIAGLTALRDNLTAIKTLFEALSNSLSHVISDTESLLKTWSDIQTRLKGVKSVDRKVTEEEKKQILAAWTKAQHDAQAFVDAVSGVAPSMVFKTNAAPHAALLATPGVMDDKHNFVMPKLPTTRAELDMANVLNSVGIHVVTAAPKASAATLLAANKAVSDTDKQRVLKAAGPPSNTQAVLNDTNLQTSGVMKQFNDLLQVPFLNQLQCNNPDKPSEKINIQTMVTNYQKMYWALQQDTVPVAQDLQTYSNTVIALLPKVTSNSSAGPGEITVQTYLNAHQKLADQYKGKADAIFTKSLNYKNAWDNAINAVRQAINECDTNIKTWEKTIDDLNAEIKKLTLKAALMGVGAILCFAAAAFVPGGMLVSGALIAGGVALMGMTIDAIIQIGKLHGAINELKAQITNAQNTQAKLNELIPFMIKIQTSLTNITGVWKDITQGLNDVQAWNTLLIEPTMLDIVRPELITSWTTIKEATQKYMDIITGKSK